jgi:predicted secreted hydrolase
MFYAPRRRDGTRDPFSAGTFVSAEGAACRLDPDDVRLDDLAHWTSPRSGVRYPARWPLGVPSLDLELEIEPRLATKSSASTRATGKAR